jgi:hypothetical protein
MSYRLIKGEFHIYSPTAPKQGPEPDGDTIKFKPDSPQFVELLTHSGHSPAFNKQNMINIRFEGIDALELHFEGAFQNLEWAKNARDLLLSKLGFGKVTFFQEPSLANRVESVEHHPVKGYIVASSLDTYGRIIAFVFGGSTDLPDGFNYFLKKEDLDKSMNVVLLKEGYVYPTFYTTLPRDLTEYMRGITVATKKESKGLWKSEDINSKKGHLVSNLGQAEILIMWPKLFRRLASYFNAGNTGLSHFDTWLRADPIQRDDSIQLPDGSTGNMHDVIQLNGDAIQLKYEPEDLVVLPDPGVVPTPTPSPKALKGDVRIIAALTNPVGADKGNEYVLLVNTTPYDISIDKWQLLDKSTNKQLLSGKLSAQDIQKIALQQTFTLNNDADTISLIDDQHQLVDEATYSNEKGKKPGYLTTF